MIFLGVNCVIDNQDVVPLTMQALILETGRVGILGSNHRWNMGPLWWELIEASKETVAERPKPNSTSTIGELVAIARNVSIGSCLYLPEKHVISFRFLTIRQEQQK